MSARCPKQGALPAPDGSLRVEADRGGFPDPASMAPGPPAPTACMDPWMTVTSGDVTTLFGYCRWHQLLGGRSWCRSSPVVWLDEGRKLARTLSGRLYALGERIEVAALPDEEARLAHFFLTEPVQPWSDPDWQADLLWLAAQKVSRWIGVPAPGRGKSDELSRYLRGTRTVYFAALQAASGGHP